VARNLDESTVELGPLEVGELQDTNSERNDERKEGRGSYVLLLLGGGVLPDLLASIDTVDFAVARGSGDPNGSAVSLMPST